MEFKVTASSSSAMKSKLERSKKKMVGFPCVPENFNQLFERMPERLTRISDDNMFMIHSGRLKRGSSQFAFTFTLETGLSMLLSEGLVTWEGNCKLAPKPFRHVLIGSMVMSGSKQRIPVVWSVLLHKSEEAYRLAVFSPIQKKLIDLQRI